ncbi:MAG: SRPBCC family protein [Streptosporangiaceae bacterium]|jgi:carbon monoxide dehydrogenase subunit G
MAHYHATVPSRRSAQDTFDYLSTFSNAAQWDPGVLAGEQLDAGPVRAGTRFRLTVPFLGRRLALTYQITKHVPHREVVLDAASPLLKATDRIAVTPAGQGATVSYDADVRLRGPLGLLDPVMRRGFEGVGGRAAAGLASALSAVPAPPGTS